MKPETLLTQPGDILFKENDPSKGLYLIQEGVVEIFRSREGAEVVLCALKAGDVIGTMTMISKTPRTASARCKEKCVLAFYPNENLKEGFKEIPVWARAVIKDTIARVQEVNEKLIESTLRERTLQRGVGTVYHHSAQLAYLLSAFIRKGTIIDDTQTPLYPIQDFLIQAEFIFIKKYAYLETIFKVFLSHQIFKLAKSQKYGNVIVHPDAQILEDYANFTLSAVKKGTNYFIPRRFYKWMEAILQMSKKYNNLGQFERTKFIELLKVEKPSDEIEVIIAQLIQFEVLHEDKNLINFSPDKVHKTIIFESVIKDLKDVKM